MIDYYIAIPAVIAGAVATYILMSRNASKAAARLSASRKSSENEMPC